MPDWVKDVIRCRVHLSLTKTLTICRPISRSFSMNFGCPLGVRNFYLYGQYFRAERNAEFWRGKRPSFGVLIVIALTLVHDGTEGCRGCCRICPRAQGMAERMLGVVDVVNGKAGIRVVDALSLRELVEHVRKRFELPSFASLVLAAALRHRHVNAHLDPIGKSCESPGRW